MRSWIILLALAAASCAGAEKSCPPESGIALQVLGSGGPIADDARASTAYLVWVDGQSKVMIDVGSGSFLRFGEAGSSFSELDFVGLSHFHTDHSADFVALLKSGNFSGRKRALTVAGPSGDGPFPGLDAYLQRLIGSGGAYAYLSGYLDGSAGLAKLNAIEVDGSDVKTVFGGLDEEMQIEAVHVPHGIVPALAFRVTVGDTRIVFSSDQNGSDPDYVSFVNNADALVMHMVVPEDATGVATSLHARPSTIGVIARQASPQVLVLSHFMARSLKDKDASIEIVRKAFDGRIVAAEDLTCIVL